MFVVITRVSVEPGSIDELPALFAQRFTGPPAVSINEILVEM